MVLVRRVTDGDQVWLQMEDTFFILAETVVNPEVVDQLPLIDKADIPTFRSSTSKRRPRRTSR